MHFGKAGKAGYGPQNRLGTFAKKKIVKSAGPKKKRAVKKDDGGIKKALKKGKVTKAKTSSKPQNKRQVALKKRADARDKKPKKKGYMKDISALTKDKKPKKGGRKTLAQLRKEGKINF